MLNISYGSFSLEFPKYIDSDAQWYKNAEMQTKQFYINNIKNNFNIIDAGAQIGMYSVLFSKLTNGTVYSFEPTDNINLLNENLQYHKCKNVKVYDLALSNINGVFKDKIYKIWSQQIVDDKEFNFITIDKFVKDNNIKLDLLKVDVDSYDYETLLGSKETLLNQNPIVVAELNIALLKRNKTVQESIDFMKSINYNVVGFYDNDNYVFKKG